METNTIFTGEHEDRVKQAYTTLEIVSLLLITAAVAWMVFAEVTVWMVD